jgi:hypothetical protein
VSPTRTSACMILPSGPLNWRRSARPNVFFRKSSPVCRKLKVNGGAALLRSCFGRFAWARPPPAA